MDEAASTDQPATGLERSATASELQPATSVAPAVARRLRAARPDLAFLAFGSAGLLAAALIRLALLPTRGYPFDLDQFVLWAHQLTNTPLGDAYRLGLPYPPVMIYVLWALGALDRIYSIRLSIELDQLIMSPLY